MINVLVTGSKGQLALCIKDVVEETPKMRIIYTDIEELDITDSEKVKTFFKEHSISHCINCAAYTAVDAAESNHSLAKAVNEDGAICLAKACKELGAVLIHISTDFVFDGEKTDLYTERDETNPLSVYGRTKLNGEIAISRILERHFIIRTSWLYSEYQHNFVKTMLRLGNERDAISVVCDQIGTPTYAGDFAKVLVNIILEDSSSYGTYHYSNEGVASWYDFAKAIFDKSDTLIKLKPIKTEEYPTPATRPKFSVMDKGKIKKVFKLDIPYWGDSLEHCIKRIN